MEVTARQFFVFLLAFLVLSDGFSSASASIPPTSECSEASRSSSSPKSSPSDAILCFVFAKIVGGFLSSAIARLMKWAWSLKTTTKTAISGHQMKFESGYEVETVFDGSKVGIEPYSVELLPSGDLLILDSANSNLYRISTSLSQFTRPKLVAGSPDGYSGHVDGKYKEARMNHPKGVAVDDKGNIYVADTMNMAIRKISESGVTTIAGGKRSRGSDHVDGPSEDAKLSNDFDVVYTGSSCSLLVIDRGNRAIREIQLNFDDCAYQYETGFPFGLAVLLAAVFFGYMLALLQRRLSSQNEWTTGTSMPPTQYQNPPKSVRPPLIPSEVDPEKQDEGFLGLLGKLLINASSPAAQVLSNIFSSLQKKPPPNTYLYQTQTPYAWPSQESFEVPREDAPPTIEVRAPKKTYAFMSKNVDKLHHQLRQSQVFYNGRHQQHLSAAQTF